MKKTIILFTFIFSLFTFSGCSPQKRLDNLIKRYPALLMADTIKHTFTHYDTLYTKPISFDTLVITNIIDTIILTQNNLTTQLIRHHDSIWIYTNYTGDTIYYQKTIEREIPVERIQYIKPDNWGLFIKRIPYIAMAITSLALAAIYFRKK